MSSGYVNKETRVEGNPLCWVALRNAIENHNEGKVIRIGIERFLVTENEANPTDHLIII